MRVIFVCSSLLCLSTGPLYVDELVVISIQGYRKHHFTTLLVLWKQVLGRNKPLVCPFLQCLLEEGENTAKIKMSRNQNKREWQWEVIKARHFTNMNDGLLENDSYSMVVAICMKLGARGATHVEGVTRVDLSENSSFSNLLLINGTARLLKLVWF
ncbi:unnamed protein product [Prunus armeniaca]